MHTAPGGNDNDIPLLSAVFNDVVSSVLLSQTAPKAVTEHIPFTQDLLIAAGTDPTCTPVICSAVQEQPEELHMCAEAESTAQTIVARASKRMLVRMTITMFFSKKFNSLRLIYMVRRSHGFCGPGCWKSDC